MYVKDGALMVSKETGHVWGRDLQVGVLGLDMGYFITFFIGTERRSMFRRKGIWDELIKTRTICFIQQAMRVLT